VVTSPGLTAILISQLKLVCTISGGEGGGGTTTLETGATFGGGGGGGGGKGVVLFFKRDPVLFKIRLSIVGPVLSEKSPKPQLIGYIEIFIIIME